MKRLCSVILAGIPLAVSVFLSGCGGSSHSSGPTVYRGVYTEGFEVSSLRNCGRTNPWWVSGKLDAIHDYLVQQNGGQFPSGYPSVYIEVKGSVSAPGSYGQLGAYEREIDVSDVTTITSTVPDACH